METHKQHSSSLPYIPTLCIKATATGEHNCVPSFHFDYITQMLSLPFEYEKDKIRDLYNFAITFM